jgi:protein phosphatase
VSDDRVVEVEVSARTDLGQTREHNEDTFLVADLTQGTTDFLDDGRAVVGPRGSLFLVADGMGGAAAGEIASAMAAEVIFQHLRTWWSRDSGGSGDEFIVCLRDAVEVANERIHHYALEHPDSRGMGTTATVVGVFGQRLHLAQVGDSRAYLIRSGAAVQLTRDQSLMQRLIDAGELTEEQAAQSERRNIILQALGPDPRIRVDVSYQDLSRGDVLIICSDGLSGQVKRDELGPLVADLGDVRAICNQLIAMANERGGPDNITAVVARFDGVGLPEPGAGEELGYHYYPLPIPEATEEQPVIAAPPAGAEAPPPPAIDSEPSLPAPRSGSPVVMAAVGVIVLLILLALSLLLT